MRAIRRIIVHCSDTPDSPGASWDDIERFHTSYSYRGQIITRERALSLIGKGETVRRPWVDIGYHAGVELIGDDYLCLYGRPLQIAGAHCRGQNDDSLGFMFCGDFDHAPPPREMLEVAARRVLGPWLIAFGLHTNDVLAHRYFDSSKTCPGTMFDMDVLRAIMRGQTGR